MKITSWLCGICLFSCASMQAQGVFSYSNVAAPTRIGSLTGPLAGTNIYGQLLLGRSGSSLSPIGRAWAHLKDSGANTGVFVAGSFEVQGVLPEEQVFMQAVAWDSLLWGQRLENVPAEFLGRTDVVLMIMSDNRHPDNPPFIRPAVVPVPEPSIVWLACAAIVVFFGKGLRAWGLALAKAQ